MRSPWYSETFRRTRGSRHTARCLSPTGGPTHLTRTVHSCLSVVPPGRQGMDLQGSSSHISLVPASAACILGYPHRPVTRAADPLSHPETPMSHSRLVRRSVRLAVNTLED